MACIGMAYVVTGRIRCRQHLAGGVSWGCSGGALERPCGDHLHPESDSDFMETLFLKKIDRFFFLRHVDVWWFCPMWPKCAFGDPKGLIGRKDMPFGNPPYHRTKIADFKGFP